MTNDVNKLETEEIIAELKSLTLITCAQKIIITALLKEMASRTPSSIEPITERVRVEILRSTEPESDEQAIVQHLLAEILDEAFDSSKTLGLIKALPSL